MGGNSSKFEKFIQHYLSISVRLTSYVSNYYFGTFLNPLFDKFITVNSAIKQWLFFVYGMIVYETIYYLVNKNYHPKYVKASEVTVPAPNPNNLLVVDDQSYEYRYNTTKLILTSSIYYVYNLILSLLLLFLFSFSPDGSGNGTDIIFGFLGGFFTIFNFFAVLVLITAPQIKSFGHRLFSYIFGGAFTLPLIIYFLHTLKQYFNLG